MEDIDELKKKLAGCQQYGEVARILGGGMEISDEVWVGEPPECDADGRWYKVTDMGNGGVYNLRDREIDCVYVVAGAGSLDVFDHKGKFVTSPLKNGESLARHLLLGSRIVVSGHLVFVCRYAAK